VTITRRSLFNVAAVVGLVQFPGGSLPPQSEDLLAGLAAWMKVNSEAIHGTRPWKVFGEGPTNTKADAFAESGDYTAQDTRFTTKNGALYAMLPGWPQRESAIPSLGSEALPNARTERIDPLGGPKLRLRREAGALRLTLPPPQGGVFIPVQRIRGRGLT
jgi:alpha-L-fucosidase